MKRLLLVFLLLGFGAFLRAETPEKKVLTVNDYASWRTLSGTRISDGGKFAAYELNPQRGNGKLVINWLDSRQEDSIPRGFDASFSPEENYLVFKIKQPVDSLKKAELKKVKKENMPQDSLGIMLLKNRKAYRYPQVKSYAISKENAGWIAFLSELSFPKKEQKDKEEGEADKKKKPAKGSDKKIKTLILFNAKTADTLQFRNVSEYVVSKKGQSIAFIRETGDSVKNTSVMLFETANQKLHTVFQADGFSKKIALNLNGNQFAFLYSPDTAKVKTFVLKIGDLERDAPYLQVDKDTEGMPIEWVPGENGDVSFSDDGTKVFFGTALKPRPEPKDSLTAEEKVQVDVWSWLDQDLQSQQKVDLDKEKKRTYLACYWLADHKFIQLADPIIQDVRTVAKGNGRYALGRDDNPYRRMFSWTGHNDADYYLVDVKTGIKRLMVSKIERAWLSPQGNYVVWYNPTDSSYYARSTAIENQNINCISKQIPVSFCDELNDRPDDASPYGIAGWGKDDRYVYVYDRYDIWRLDPAMTKVPVNVTRGFGRRSEVRLRYQRLDPEEEFIDPEKANMVSSFDEKSKAGGFFSVDFKNFQEPRMLIAEDFKFGSPQKAKNQDKLIYTKESCTEFPNLWVSNMQFDRPKKISDANPQQKKYNWMDVMMVSWTSFSGKKLEGLLYMPENFSPHKKYPMIVYYYERNSDTKHQHYIPSPSRSTINKTFYCSNGYLVFVPDITYKSGYPGQSAYDAIVSGTYHLINSFAFVDEKKIGIQGQSWGGYQTAYLITQTDMFAAAMAGAPVSNMTSAYGGIRWESGISRMFQYEHDQSRIGGTLWDKTMQYIENSPLFYAPKVKTPLLIMHNDNDGAVPWYQGIEYFTALRRLNKPVWMLTYNNEPHNLKRESWGDRMDLDIRMKGFFDFYLKGLPMPAWMRHGVPAIDKGRVLGY